jgi:hypothetical protein
VQPLVSAILHKPEGERKQFRTHATTLVKQGGNETKISFFYGRLRRIASWSPLFRPQPSGHAHGVIVAVQ